MTKVHRLNAWGEMPGFTWKTETDPDGRQFLMVGELEAREVFSLENELSFRRRWISSFVEVEDRKWVAMVTDEDDAFYELLLWFDTHRECEGLSDALRH